MPLHRTFEEIEFDVDPGASLGPSESHRNRHLHRLSTDDGDSDVRWDLMSAADSEHFTIRKNANGNPASLSFKNP